MIKQYSGDKEKALRTFIKELFEKNIINAAFLPIKQGETAFPALITSAEAVETSALFLPVMPVSSATQLVRLTHEEPLHKTTIAFLRPCEMRAAVELIKLNQIKTDNLIFVGVDCEGTYDAKDLEKNDIREVCKICEFPETLTGDIKLAHLGLDSIYLTPISNKGQDLLEKTGNLEDNSNIEKEHNDYIEKIKKEHLLLKETFLKEKYEEVKGLENLQKYFETCINCHNCMQQCPICYCHECFFDSRAFYFKSEQFITSAKRREALKFPTDTLLFHIGRMNHMVLSCVNCGLCEQACPMDIKVGQLFTYVNAHARDEFGYVSGKNIEDELPLTTYREDEFKNVGEK